MTNYSLVYWCCITSIQATRKFVTNLCFKALLKTSGCLNASHLKLLQSIVLFEILLSTLSIFCQGFCVPLLPRSSISHYSIRTGLKAHTNLIRFNHIRIALVITYNQFVYSHPLARGWTGGEA